MLGFASIAAPTRFLGRTAPSTSNVCRAATSMNVYPIRRVRGVSQAGDSSPVAAPTPGASSASTAPKASGSVVKNPRDAPIGGATGKPSPPTPFSLFRKHKPTKLPKGHPKPYDSATSP
jgi:hypothetical protein